jgi:hypothetical protein
MAWYQVQQQMKINNSEIRKIAKTIFEVYFRNFDTQIHSALNSVPIYLRGIRFGHRDFTLWLLTLPVYPHHITRYLVKVRTAVTHICWTVQTNMPDSVITLLCLYCNMASKRNFLAKFPGITTILNIGILADYTRTLGLLGRQRDNNTK